MRRYVLSAFASLPLVVVASGNLMSGHLSAQHLSVPVDAAEEATASGIAWTELELGRPGLEAVNDAVNAGDDRMAADALLAYFRGREDLRMVREKTKRRSLSALARRMADDALEHRFYAHEGYQPSYCYGKEIDWTYWPVKDNELRWQLHRQKWFLPLLRMYTVSGDVRYFDAWLAQRTDWARKNPWPGTTTAERENARFAWRPLETSHRLSDLPEQLALALPAPGFTPEALKTVLADVQFHGDQVWARRSAKGNHLLFEMKRLLDAATAFPELKAAARWRRNTVETLRAELRKQVYPDGVQYELDLGYHIAALNLFRAALCLAPDMFDATDRVRIGRMAAFTEDLVFPDLTHPFFADTHLYDTGRLRDNLMTWRKAFPEAFDRPSFVSRAYLHGGFYVLREGMPETGTMVVLKAGPPAFWHNQPDNGTFSYWRKGRDFLPDSGSYVYGGSDNRAARAAFRASTAHSTLTLDDRDVATDSRLLNWHVADDGVTQVTVETASYPNLCHRRTLRLEKGGALTVTDETSGDAEGMVAVRFCLASGAALERLPDGTWRTNFPDGNDIRLRFDGPVKLAVTVEEGWFSSVYGKKTSRPVLCLKAQTSVEAAFSLRTCILPL